MKTGMVALAVIVVALAVENRTAGGGKEPAARGRLEGATPAGNPTESKEPREQLAAGNTAFAIDLYGELRGQKGNFFFSPLSVSTALTMTYAGARDTTANEMYRVLHLPMYSEPADQPDPEPGEAPIMKRYPWRGNRVHAAFRELNGTLTGKAGEEAAYELSLANSLWGQEDLPWKREFLDLTRTYYGAGLREVNFGDLDGARRRINEWVAKETRGKITELFAPGVLPEDMLLVLANAIHFKADWASKFEGLATRESDFSAPGDPHGDEEARAVKVQMMHQTGGFPYMETEDFQILEMPYRGGDLSMVILLPRNAFGLRLVEEALTAEKLAQWLDALRAAQVGVSLPRFTIESSLRLDETVKAMGMERAFTPEQADFSGMLPPAAVEGPVYIGAVVHGAYVAVAEEGTEAAAATGVAMGGLAAYADPKIFRADHPFLFLIRDRRTDSILFMCRLVDPPGTTIQAAPGPRDIRGTWKSIDVGENKEIQTLTYTFGPDGALKASVVFKDGERLETEGQYELNGDVLRVRYEGKPRWQEWGVRLDGDALTFLEDGEKNLIFKRQ